MKRKTKIIKQAVLSLHILYTYIQHIIQLRTYSVASEFLDVSSLYTFYVYVHAYTEHRFSCDSANLMLFMLLFSQPPSQPPPPHTTAVNYTKLI